jgi:hypothetical protein
MPITTFDKGVASTKDRTYQVGLDQVTAIEVDAGGDLLVTMTDELDEDAQGNPVTIKRDTVIPRHQIRIIQRTDKGE